MPRVAFRWFVKVLGVCDFGAIGDKLQSSGVFY